eukprot:TRINITY_DN7437_c0_g3_i3.p1 TRINITY_DN7437_c0_g3~~TRINITY_DN7437_c0_g3_i3.p1  ORF type:complete len:200 (-),score=24.97 TRINITY_DN7437_c0_g3_i3:94-693(-)
MTTYDFIISRREKVRITPMISKDTQDLEMTKKGSETPANKEMQGMPSSELIIGEVNNENDRKSVVSSATGNSLNSPDVKHSKEENQFTFPREQSTAIQLRPCDSNPQLNRMTEWMVEKNMLFQKEDVVLKKKSRSRQSLAPLPKQDLDETQQAKINKKPRETENECLFHETDRFNKSTQQLNESSIQQSNQSKLPVDQS